MKKRNLLISILSIISILIACPGVALAADSYLLPINAYDENIVSVVLPVVSEGEDSPFAFKIDPQQLIYATDAARYGGGTVDEGATILFRNHEEGMYNFSRYSDRLKVTNQSTVPVNVTVTACMYDLGDIYMVGSPEFGDSDGCSMYMAVVDDEGNELPISEYGEVSMSVEMRQAPDNAYMYYIDEANGSYTYGFTMDPEYIDFDSYSFGLVGYCNPNGRWEDISVHPRVEVTWDVQPVLYDQIYEEEGYDDNTLTDSDPSVDIGNTGDTQDGGNTPESVDNGLSDQGIADQSGVTTDNTVPEGSIPLYDSIYSEPEEWNSNYAEEVPVDPDGGVTDNNE